MTVLHEFSDGTDGAYPWAPPIQAPDGSIYGVTYNGTNQGKAYRITKAGKFSVIADLPSKTQAPLILGDDGHLYGTTPYGGAENHGTVFQLTTTGKLKIIHSFNDGTNPGGPVLQASDGKLYGTTFWGGAAGATTGNVTVLEPGGNLVTPQTFKVIPKLTGFSPQNGPVGTSVTIDGMSLTQITAVTFGGVTASNFTVDSDTQITAIVPAGAVTGEMGITTQGGKVTGTGTFTVN